MIGPVEIVPVEQAFQVGQALPPAIRHPIGADGAIGLGRLDRLAAGLASVLRVSVSVSNQPLDPAFAFSPERRQFYSTRVLAALAERPLAPGARVLGVTSLDLYVPVLTFVFGEAQLKGPAALVSLHRLADDFYGLPANEATLHARLLKEAVHELGHTFGLRHCDDWQCAMASTHTVELLDLKKPAFCHPCRGHLGL
jgi:archaemetzincin